jgi:hypothetical protein
MDWDAIGAVGEIIGAAAVVATIFYLSVQVRQNSRSVEENVRALRLTAADATVEGFARYRDRVSQPDLAALVVKGRDSYQVLSESERLQFGAIMDEYMFSYWCVFMRRREGAYDNVDWQAHLEGIRENLSFPGATEWWQSRKKVYSPVFVAELQSYGI